MKKLSLMVLVFVLAGCSTINEAHHKVKMLDPQYAAEYEKKQRSEASKNKFLQSCKTLGGETVVDETVPDFTAFISKMTHKLNQELGLSIPTPTKNNMFLNFQIYSMMMEAANRTDFLIGLGQKSVGATEPCMQNLIKKRDKLIKLAGNICEYSYDYEKTQFPKLTGGYTLDSVGQRVMNVANPSSKKLYTLTGSKVLQNIPGAVLITDTQANVRYLNTQYTYPDDGRLKGFAEYVGIKQYSTVLGVNKTVYAFTEIPESKYKKVLSKNFFYSTRIPNRCVPVRKPTDAEVKSLLNPTDTSVITSVQAFNNAYSEPSHDPLKDYWVENMLPSEQWAARDTEWQNRMDDKITVKLWYLFLTNI